MPRSRLSSAAMPLSNRPSKRARLNFKRWSASVRRLPVAQRTEMKYNAATLLGSTTWSSIMYQGLADAIAQGDDGSQYTGSKFTIWRIRVFYNFTPLASPVGSSPNRITVFIPKDPTDSVINGYSPHEPVNTRKYTVLKDLIVNNHSSAYGGWFDIKGPFHVEMNDDGTVALRNNVRINAYSETLTDGTSGLIEDSRVAYQMWFTDN